MRYARQEALEQIGRQGQKKLLKSKVVIVGVGALGTVTCELLARAGVGEILLIDNDEVHLVNLQRQLFLEEDIGKSKAKVMQKRVSQINKDVKVKVFEEFLTEQNSNVLTGYDLILDCTDNMKARQVINAHCKTSKQIWIHAAGSSVKGNLVVIDDPERFEKIFKTAQTFDSCEEIGVINSLTMTISSLQVVEAIKILTDQSYCKDLIRINLWENKYERYKI